jgi:hypothetical protein
VIVTSPATPKPDTRTTLSQPANLDAGGTSIKAAVCRETVCCSRNDSHSPAGYARSDPVSAPDRRRRLRGRRQSRFAKPTQRDQSARKCRIATRSSPARRTVAAVRWRPPATPPSRSPRLHGITWRRIRQRHWPNPFRNPPTRTPRPENLADPRIARPGDLRTSRSSTTVSDDTPPWGCGHRSNTRESTTTTLPQHSRIKRADSTKPGERQALREIGGGSAERERTQP